MMRSMHRVVVLAMLVGCGPVAYVNQVTLTADSAVESARAANAEKWSPYYWTRAITYLHMAREVAGHADFQGANRFGRLAAEAAVHAKEEAEIGAQDPSKLPYIHLDVEKDKPAPAKDAPAVAPAKEEP
jgi:sRNA-binding protein